MPTDPGRISRIQSIAGNTFREAVRDRVLYNLIVFVLIITASAIFLGDLTAGKEARTIVNLGLSAVLLFGVFIAIFVGVGLVSKEIEKRTLYTVFSKPVSRGEFILGKYLGLCLTLLVNVSVMGLGVSAALLYVGGSGLALSIWGTVILIFFELTIVTAVAIVFSSFSSPSLSALLSFLVFVIGHFSYSLRDFAENLGSDAAKVFFGTIYYLLPNFSHFEFVTNAAHGDFPPLVSIAGGLAYTFVYVSILLMITVFVFNRRNLK